MRHSWHRASLEYFTKTIGLTEGVENMLMVSQHEKAREVWDELMANDGQLVDGEADS